MTHPWHARAVTPTLAPDAAVLGLGFVLMSVRLARAFGRLHGGL